MITILLPISTGHFCAWISFALIAQRKTQEMTMDRFEIKAGSTHQQYQTLKKTGKDQHRSLRARVETNAEGEKTITLFLQDGKEGLLKKLENSWYTKEQTKLAKAYCEGLEEHWNDPNNGDRLTDKYISSIHTNVRKKWDAPAAADANKAQAQELELESRNRFETKPEVNETAKSISTHVKKPGNVKDAARREQLSNFEKALTKFVTGDPDAYDVSRLASSLNENARKMHLDPETLERMVSASITKHLKTLERDALWKYFRGCMENWPQAEHSDRNSSQLLTILRECLCKCFANHSDSRIECVPKDPSRYPSILRESRMPGLTQLANDIENKIYQECSGNLNGLAQVVRQAPTYTALTKYKSKASGLSEKFLEEKSLPTQENVYTARLDLAKKEFLPILDQWKKQREQASYSAETFHEFLQKAVNLSFKSGIWSDLFDKAQEHRGNVAPRAGAQFLYDIMETEDRSIVQADADKYSSDWRDLPNFGPNDKPKPIRGGQFLWEIRTPAFLKDGFF